jgi:MFS family permease
MQVRAIFKKASINPKSSVVNVILLANAFIWYFLAFNILREVVDTLNVAANYEVILIFGANFIGIAVSGIIGSVLIGRLKRRVPFLYLWTFAGIFFSLIPLIFNVGSVLGLAVVSGIFGVYFGLGMPATMGYFSASTEIEHRSKLSGITFLLIGLAFFGLGNIALGDIILACSILVTVRIVGLLLLCLLKIEDKPLQEGRRVTYADVFSNRSFMLYFVPWCMFSLVNNIVIPVASKLFLQGEEFLRLSTIFENILIAAFAVVSGFLADIFGRKRLTIVGFAMLGIGYAVLGLAPSIEGWYFYTFVDGVAWGIFYTILLFTIWGDLAQGRNSEKFYVIGALPFLFSNFLRIWLGSYVAEIPGTAIFSFASVFLFLAVLPLIYAPETLPEKTMKERELKNYIAKAQKEAEKTQNKEIEKDQNETGDNGVEIEANQEEIEEILKKAKKYY